MPDYEIAEAVRPVIQRNIEQALQNEGNIYAGAYDTSTHSGDRVEMLDEIGKATYQERNGKNQDTPNMDLPHRKRWIEPTLTPEYGHLFDENYDLHKLEDPTNAHTEAVQMAMERAKDDCLVSAFFGDAIVGRTGREKQIFNDKMVIKDDFFGTGAAEDLGLTPQKLIRVRTMFKQARVKLNRETLYMSAPSYVYEGYIGKEKVANSNYNSQLLFEKGQVDSQMSINFIDDDDLKEVLIEGVVYVQCPIWCKSGMNMGTWRQPKIELAPNPGKKFDQQLYTYGKYGATRTNERKVIMMLIKKDLNAVGDKDFAF